MDVVEREALLDAVNALIRSPNAQELFDSLDALVPIARRHPIKLAGEAAVVNPLLHLRVTDLSAYDRLMALIEGKRREQGLPPLTKEPEVRFDKTDYMRGFMEQKRDRQRRAADIENLIREPKDRLIGRARLDFMQAQSARWKKERDAVLDAARAANKGHLHKDQLRGILQAFWARIDRELDELEKMARAELVKPAHQRRKVDASMEQLHEALTAEP